MTTNSIIGISAIVLVIIGGFYLFEQDSIVSETSVTEMLDDKKQNASTTTKNEGGETVITYTNEGFEPRTVTIKRGQSIRWINNNSRQMWPASAIHPSHSIYPEKTTGDCLGSAFDACIGITTGDSWEFTFNAVGTWYYHDHLSANHTGTVEVQ